MDFEISIHTLGVTAHPKRSRPKSEPSEIMKINNPSHTDHQSSVLKRPCLLPIETSLFIDF
jgi:hypothetical protein